MTLVVCVQLAFLEILCRCFELHCTKDVSGDTSKAATEQKQNRTSSMESDAKTKVELQQLPR